MRREKLFTTYLNDNQEVHYIITTVIIPPGLNKDKQIILQMHSFLQEILSKNRKQPLPLLR